MRASRTAFVGDERDVIAASNLSIRSEVVIGMSWHVRGRKSKD